MYPGNYLLVRTINEKLEQQPYDENVKKRKPKMLNGTVILTLFMNLGAKAAAQKLQKMGV